MRRRVILLAAVAVALIAGGIYWFGPQHLFIDRRVEESLPTGEIGGVIGNAGDDDEQDPTEEPIILAEGSFSSLAHTTTGTARIVELSDGSRFLRIEGLDTSSGPDLRVYLSAAPADGPEDDLAGDFVDLGGLKGNQGDQNYEIPANVDVDRFNSAVIWCRRFAVGFGVAPLDAA
jgi:hypothetical protein